MEITDLKIRKIMTDGRLRAIVSITLDQMLAVHDIKVVQGETRLFVAMPSRKDEGGIFRDIVHPISAGARQYLETQILNAYQEQLALIQAEAEVTGAGRETGADRTSRSLSEEKRFMDGLQRLRSVCSGYERLQRYMNAAANVIFHCILQRNMQFCLENMHVHSRIYMKHSQNQHNSVLE